MTTMRTRLAALSAAALMATACAAAVTATGVASARPRASSGPCTGASAPARYQHVVWIAFENRSYSEVIGHAPYIDSLAAQCGSATNMHNVSHPSLPNYLAMTSGSTHGVTTDCPKFCPVSGPSIFGQSPSWKVYAESQPGNCVTHDARPYVAHHTSAPYYRDLTNCSANDQPLTAMNPASLPAFTMIIPNVNYDMHEKTSSVLKGDAWLRTKLPALLATADYQAGRTAIVVTWDEGGFPRRGSNCVTSPAAGCQIATIVLAKAVTPGLRPSTSLSLYGLLRGTEEMLGYPLLGAASSAPSLRTAFGL